MAIKDLYFTISEAAKELNVSRQTVYRWIADNKIPTEKIGGVILVEKGAINKCAEEKLVKSLFNMFDRLAFDSLRQELGYTNKDVIERLENEGDHLVFLVTHEDGAQEKLLVGNSELTVRDSPKRPMPDMKMKFTDIVRRDYKQPKSRRESKKVKERGVVA